MVEEYSQCVSCGGEYPDEKICSNCNKCEDCCKCGKSNEDFDENFMNDED